MKLSRNNLPIILMLTSLLIFTGSKVFAYDQSAGTFFDAQTAYDIYFVGEEHSSSLLKNVEIIRIQEIDGEKFLIVRPAGFKLKQVDGFVRMSAIVAILPNYEFSVQITPQKINF